MTMDEMSRVWKKKEYLRDCTDLPVKMGRGRLSGEHHAALTEAAARGVRFSDYTPVKTETITVVKDKTPSTRVRVVRDEKPAPTPENSEYLFPDEYRYPEDEYVAKDDNGNKYSMREACNFCRLSLVNHKCEQPSVHGIPVRVVRK